jgi:hypothetical protein
MAKKNWIKSALKANTKGALHKELKVPIGIKIPAAKLDKAENSKNPKLKKRAVLAATLGKFKKK